jgi:hypothetical protein
MTQQSRANKADGHHHRRAQKNRRLGTAMGEAVAVDHRPDSLAEIEEARVQRSGRSARGLREFGDMDLDTAVQQVESEPEHGVDGDLPKPGEVQRDEDQTSRGERAAGDHQTALPHAGNENRHRERVQHAAYREGGNQETCN